MGVRCSGTKSSLRIPREQGRGFGPSLPFIDGTETDSEVAGLRSSRCLAVAPMIEVICNDRLGKKVRVKVNEDDTVGDLKKLVAAQVGTR